MKPVLSPWQVWLRAVRPRTLPLAAGAVILGSGLAALGGHASPTVTGLALLTAILLQVVSNLANDYGDAVAGADTTDRRGPARMVGSGFATRESMFRAILLAGLLAGAAGTALVCVGAWNRWPVMVAFFGLGLASLLAATAYTMGKRPYGYRGLGDVMAGLFFGPVAVLGTVVLHGAGVQPAFWLPALAAGCCSTAVLNINNLRDIETDRLAGKMTVAVRLGLQRGRVYHAGLTTATLGLWGLFWLQVDWRLLPALLLGLPLALSAWRAVRGADDPDCLNAQLKHTVLASFLLNGGMGLLCWLAGSLP